METSQSLKKIGIFYGSTTCYTEIVAEKILDKLNELIIQRGWSHLFSIDLFNTKDSELRETESYDILLLGISTWDFGEIQEDWLKQWHDISSLALDNKIIALFGLGDQEGYSEWFLDAMGLLFNALAKFNVHWSGFWPIAGYEFTSTLPTTLDNSLFVGLALDEDSQYELTDSRIQSWCQQILNEWAYILQLK